MLCQILFVFDSHKITVAERLLSANNVIGATQNIRHGTCPVGLQSNLRTGIMFQCRHEFAVHENEVLTAPLSAGKEPTESLTWYAGFPV